MNIVNHSPLDWFYIIVSCLALAFVSLTMLLRGNDYRRKGVVGRIATIRITGFVLAGFTPWLMIPLWIVTGQLFTVLLMFFLVGVSAIFFTTENLPPWWSFLTVGDRRKEVRDDNAGDR